MPGLATAKSEAQSPHQRPCLLACMYRDPAKGVYAGAGAGSPRQE